MPELPEVETIAASLRKKIVGLTIAEIELFLPKLLRNDDATALRKFRGAAVTGVKRRGKMLLLACSGDLHLLFHLKMTGQFYWARKSAGRDAHTHLRMSFRNRDRELRFRDVRKFGFLRLLDTPFPDESAELRALGPEPLELDIRDFGERIARRKGRLKSLLLDQSFLAGIGNIYADEILFASRLHPLTPAASLKAVEIARLWTGIRDILEKAIAAGGSSIRDYKDADGVDGLFQEEHRVYGRRGLPCPRCGARVVRRVIGGRGSFFCPRCQRKKAKKA
jgi:formamidopyrimidine-DNA glycosylase